MKKRIVALLFGALVLINSSFAARQDRIIKGRVVDAADGEALEWVTVAVRDASGKIYDGATTDALGAFKLNAAGGSELYFSLLGYKDVVVKELSNDMCVRMEEDTESIAAATVVDKAKLVELKLDKVVMNIGRSAFAQGSNGLELIKKAPGVVIDKDGNITLNGKSVAVWIDGRPSYLDGKSLEALLRSTDGGSIDKFEIMEHPSSKYDASGSGGIINIKTKKNALAGFNGSLGFDAGGMYFAEQETFPWQENAWVNLAYRTEKNNAFLNLYEGVNMLDYDIYIKTVSPRESNHYFTQESRSYHRKDFRNWNIKLGDDWFINKKNTLGFIVTLPGQKVVDKSDPAHNFTLQSIDDEFFRKDNTSINDDQKQNTLSTNLNYTRIFNEENASEMTANLDYYNLGSNSLMVQDLTSELAGQEGTVSSGRRVKADNGINIYSAKVDYQTLLWKRVMFEAGAKWALSSTANTTLRQESGLQVFDQTTKFTYDEHVGAAYFNAATSFGGKWSVKAGLRAEYTYSFGDWITVDQETRRSYLNLFPTVFVGYTPSQNWRFTTSYTRRINRPGYMYLNPTESYIDAHTWVVGNPELLPEINDDVMLAVGYGQHFNLAVGYGYKTNWIMQVPYGYENGDQYFAWENYGTSNSAYAALSISSLPITKWLDWTMNVSGVYLDSESYNYDYSSSSFFASAYTALTFNLPRDWKVELDGNLTTPLSLGYIRTRFQWMSNLGIKKQLCENRLTLNINVNDLFRSQSADFDMITQEGAEVVTLQHFNFQKINIGLSWSFGKSQRPVRARRVGTLEEASRTSGGNGIGN